jgi:hypothetical protein
MSPFTLNPLAPIFAPKPPQISKAPRKLQPIAPETKSTMNRISNLNVIEASSVTPRTFPKRTPITSKMSQKSHLCPSKKPKRVAPAPRLAAILPGQTVLSQYFRPCLTTKKPAPLPPLMSLPDTPATQEQKDIQPECQPERLLSQYFKPAQKQIKLEDSPASKSSVPNQGANTLTPPPPPPRGNRQFAQNSASSLNPSTSQSTVKLPQPITIVAPQRSIFEFHYF